MSRPILPPRRIADDLRGLFRGRLAFDAPTRAVYAGDASPFELVPHAVATPLDAADVKTLVEYAYENGLPLTARGAGTGLAGESLGTGVVVDLSVHFRRVVAVGPDWVRAEPGVTWAELDAALAPHGRRFAPDPAAEACTVGGMVGTNASGSNAVRHGTTRDHVRALSVVFDTGEAAVVTVPGAALADVGLAAAPARGPRFVELRAQTAALLAEHRDAVGAARPRARFDRCGYVLHDVLAPAGLDLARLLTGSEGTLAVTTEVTLGTVPVPGGVGQLVLGFATVEAAVRAGLTLRAVEGLVGCDLLDQRLIALTRTLGAADGVGPVPPEVGAALVVGVEADSAAAAVAVLRDAARRAVGEAGGVVLAGPTGSADGLARVRRFRRAAAGGLYAPGRGPRPVTGMEDVAVPVEALPAFLPQLRAILQKFDVSAPVLVHVLAGQVHARPLIDLADPADRAKLWPLAEAVHARALAVGGTVSGQYGTGLARTPWVEAQAGAAMPVVRELKRLYDPRGILNPGKIVGPDPSRPAWPLKPAGPTPRLTPLLVWSAGDAAAQVANCNGCGDCRTRDAGRMCPVFRAVGTEDASPRAKAALMHAVLDAPDPAAGPALASPEAKAVAALCVHCKACPRECRGRVDVPKLMLEAKAAYHAANGLDRVDWVLARVEGFAAVGTKFAYTANTLLRLRPVRWVLDKAFGVTRRRALPRLTHRTFLWRAWRMGLCARPAPGSTRVGPARPRVAYFVDHFANFHDPTIALAAVAVLRHCGVEVHVPWRQRACGLAPLVQGDIDTAREAAAYNVRTLAGLVRDGFTVVCSEPTAAVVLTQEYLDLLDTPDARLVAANTVELTAYLADMHRQGTLRTDFGRLDVNLGHHVPCHVKALPTGQVPAGPGLLALIPGVQAYTLDAGCSGMAGTYGLRSDSYDASRRAGAGLFAALDQPRVMYGSTECGPCRLQMQDGGGKRTLHPVQYLALAYGLMPELRAKLARPLGRRVVD